MEAQLVSGDVSTGTRLSARLEVVFARQDDLPIGWLEEIQPSLVRLLRLGFWYRFDPAFDQVTEHFDLNWQVSQFVRVKRISYNSPLQIVFGWPGEALGVFAAARGAIALFNSYQSARLKKAETDVIVEKLRQGLENERQLVPRSWQPIKSTVRITRRRRRRRTFFWSRRRPVHSIYDEMLGSIGVQIRNASEGAPAFLSQFKSIRFVDSSEPGEDTPAEDS